MNFFTKNLNKKKILWFCGGRGKGDARVNLFFLFCFFFGGGED